jgi:hypothetical protein
MAKKGWLRDHHGFDVPGNICMFVVAQKPKTE